MEPTWRAPASGPPRARHVGRLAHEAALRAACLARGQAAARRDPWSRSPSAFGRALPCFCLEGSKLLPHCGRGRVAQWSTSSPLAVGTSAQGSSREAHTVDSSPPPAPPPPPPSHHGGPLRWFSAGSSSRMKHTIETTQTFSGVKHWRRGAHLARAASSEVRLSWTWRT